MDFPYLRKSSLLFRCKSTNKWEESKTNSKVFIFFPSRSTFGAVVKGNANRMQNEKNPPIIFFHSEKQISYPMYLCVSVVNSIWNGLAFFRGIILVSQRHRECISRKKDHWEPSSMIIPDNHKMAQNVSDSPSPLCCNPNNWLIF